ncbi:MAG: carboxylesterase family protein [Clostridiales bacterium]|nr:carboxylesterase family protein [Clostridiales bacterium]
MRKRFLPVALTVALLATLGACGKQETDAKIQEATTAAVPETEEIQENEAEGIVQTTAGAVQGTDEDGIFRYLGIPYAQVKERFVPADEVEPWEGVFVADSYGAMSPQGSISGVGGESDQTGTDNNCQNLNIWTPGVGDGEKRPVMVWLHGGGFSTGTANDESYDGEALSRSGDIVVVSVNHRLNVFGHLDLSAYDEKYQYSANVGITDIVAALEWIQENIEAFGGDPDNVTLFGQSGGGAKVLALMTSPYAKGLFHKGIVQSGATETMGVSFNTQESSTRLAENILNNLGISEDNLEEIQNVSDEELQAAATLALSQTGEELQIPAALGDAYSMDWEPVVDGDFLPTNPVTADSFADAGADIPLLIGSNLNEWTGYFTSDPVEATEELTAAIQSAYSQKDGLTAEQIDTTLIRLPILKITAHKADQNGAPVYSYVFTYGNSYHGAEIPFVFNHADGSEEEIALAGQISQAWINFAKTGTPGADGLPAWEPYTREGGATMLLDTQSELVYHHDRELLTILAPDYGDLLIDDGRSALTFPLGTKVDSDSFTGTVYINSMITKDDTYNFPSTNNVTFEPGARSSWHSHGGMVILVTGGVGYYQEEGKPAQIIRKGDVIECAEGVRHWHGAAPDSWFSQMVIWDSDYVAPEDAAPEEPVTDEEYENLTAEEYAGRMVTDDNEFMFQRADEAVSYETFSGPAYVSSVLEEGNAAGAPGLHYVVFGQSVINNWHTHEGGQILIATDGIGYHQIEGEPVQVLHPGDVALCPPGVKHWHGGSADTEFAHIAVNTNPELTGLEWFERISDEEYLALTEQTDND